MAKVPVYGLTQDQQRVTNALKSLGGGASPNYAVSYEPNSSTPSYGLVGLTHKEFDDMAQNVNNQQSSGFNILDWGQSVPAGQNTNIGQQPSWLSIPTGQNTSTSYRDILAGQQNILGRSSDISPNYSILQAEDTINAAQKGDLRSRLALGINNRSINGTPPSWWEQAVDGVMNSGLVAGAKEMGSQVGDWLSSIWGGDEAGGLNGAVGGDDKDAGGFMNQKFGGGTAMDWLGAGLQAFSVLSAYNLGKDQIANARDALNASKEQFNKNFAMAINSYNTQLEDRWRSRSMMETDTALEDNAKYLNELNSQQLNDSGNRNGGGYTHDAQRQAVAEKQKTDSQIAQESKSTSKSATDR